VLDLFKLDGKVALITGAGSGIGRAYAEAMSEAGAAVACADTDASAAEEITIPTDVADKAQVGEW